MKNHFLFLLISAYSFAFAQQPPNASFERWHTDTLSMEPTNWASSNWVYFIDGGIDPLVDRSTNAHSGEYSLRMQVGSYEGMPVPSVITWNEQEGMYGEFGKFPIDGAPTAFTAWMNFDEYFPGDTAWVGFQLTELGSAKLEMDTFVIASGSGWQEITWDFPAYSGTPDSAAIMLLSGDWDHARPGNVLLIDDIAFSGGGITDTIPNGNFEDWTAFAAQEPKEWTTSNHYGYPWELAASATRTTDAVDGMYALRIESVDTNLFDDPFGYVGLGGIGPEGPLGGVPYDAEPEGFSFQYKYTPVGGDSGIAFVRFTHWNMLDTLRDTLGEFMVRLPATPSWTLYDIPIALAARPDSVHIAFASTNIGASTAPDLPGSVLYLDDLRFTGGTVGFEDGSSRPTPAVKVFPVPAHDVLNFELGLESNSIRHIHLFDLKGQKVQSQSVNGGKTATLPLDGIVPGIYFYRVVTEKDQWVGKVVVE